MICDTIFLNNQLCGKMSMTKGYSEKVLYVISLKIVGHCNKIVYPAEQVQVKMFVTHLIVIVFSQTPISASPHGIFFVSRACDPVKLVNSLQNS